MVAGRGFQCNPLDLHGETFEVGCVELKVGRVCSDGHADVERSRWIGYVQKVMMVDVREDEQGTTRGCKKK